MCNLHASVCYFEKKTLPEENGEKRRTGGRKSTGTGK